MAIKQSVLAITLLALLYACQPQDKVSGKKEELNQLKKDYHDLKVKIAALEEEIAKEDPDFAKANRKEVLVTAVPVRNGTFTHMVEVSGNVTSKRNVVLSAENMGNIVKVSVVEGDFVRQGQLIASQDASVLQKQLSQLETQYELAESLFKKQSNLWEKKIGTEVQYLEAKNNKESLEQQIANVKTQISKSYIKAPFDGTIEKVFVNDGEMVMSGNPVAQIVNHSGMYVSADVSETYVGTFERGDVAVIEFPSIQQTIEAKITAVGQVIDPQNRTFKVEIKLPNTDFKVKPNMVAVVKIKDFEKENASIVPLNLIQQDMTGEYIYVVEKKGDDLFAKKAHIQRGKTYKNETLVLSGLNGYDQVINDGFKEVIDGSPVRIVENVL